jgi:hypothetical protein
VGLRNLVKSFINPIWGEFDAALVVFDSGDHWRLSFICDIKDEATSPKRYTYVFGSDDLLYRTPIERFNFLKKKGVSFETLKAAFSVEALSDEFLINIVSNMPTLSNTLQVSVLLKLAVSGKKRCSENPMWH